MPQQRFHPAVQAWFDNSFDKPTEVQSRAWEAISTGAHTLLAAPTGSGKTLAAFLSAIDRLIRDGSQSPLENQTRVLYISPLKALSNDIQLNLQEPLQGIRDELLAHGLPDVEINAWVRTGDTPQSERQKAAKKPPHILVTTPESVYILLTSESGRKMLSTVETVIVDEIHAVAGNKRGSHLSLSLQRLEALVRQSRPGRMLQRIGLSATQKPIEDMASFLLGQRDENCRIIDTGHTRQRDLSLEVPASPLDAVMSNEVWDEIYNRLENHIHSHKTTLVFVNTRRLTERVARFIAERIGEENVMAHHGSMAKEKRLKAEQRLKKGELKCLVATASLELGIDIGDVDLVCQLGSPRSIAAFLQRVGRSGHAVGATPRGILFPLSRDELVECTALLHAANSGELDRVVMPDKPLDVLAQQIVAEVSAGEWQLDELFDSFRSAWPYRHLGMREFEGIVRMLANGYSTRRGRRGAYLHLDAVNRRVRPRRSARLIAITNGGAIPDQFDCDVILQPEGLRIGTVGEDFAFESVPGDIFQLGNTSYRLLKTETGKIYVEDAKGQPPNLPFWLGEAPGRTDELSFAVSRLRSELDKQLDNGIERTVPWLVETYGIPESAAQQLAAYLAAARAALEVLPSQETIVFERFFDEVGDMHFVVHSSYGSRINRAWGLALRKRFCRKFNFELQAAALEDSIVLSLSSTHSFPLEEVARYLNSKTVRDVLIQALLDVPMFPTRWRWNATISLAVLRNRNGKRNPPYFQRSDAEDLVAVLFPDQIACGENIAGDRDVPDHPLVQQTIHDCLYETMDIVGLENLLQALEAGKVKIKTCDLTAPSPLAQEILKARPYAFLDDAPAEERRTMAIQSRSFMEPAEAAELGRLDSAAIDKVRVEAWPTVRTADELHDALMVLGFVQEKEGNQGKSADSLDFGWQHLFTDLCDNSRATVITTPAGNRLWIAAERLEEFQQLFPDASLQPVIEAIAGAGHQVDPLTEIVRSRLEGLGPITAEKLGVPLGLSAADIEAVLLKLEQEGFVIRGQFTEAVKHTDEWCERRLLARIHRYTINRLRNAIEPVSPQDYMNFLFHWQGLDDKSEGLESLAAVLQQLEGYPAPAAAWESEVLAARISLYTPDMLDSLCSTGRVTWLRLAVAAARPEGRKASPVRLTPITLIQRNNARIWRKLSPLPDVAQQQLSAYARKIFDAIIANGALFFMDLVQLTGLLRTQVEDALGELVNWGLVTSDSFAGLRALTTAAAKRPRFRTRRGRGRGSSPFDQAGRWSLITQPDTEEENAQLETEDLEYIAQVLLQRYGIVFRKVLERETSLPPWRDLLKIYWRMEARGEIRGGRFVQGFSGEQFALPNAIGALRKIRNRSKTGELIAISSTDPLNLTGLILPGDKVPMSKNNRILFRDGIPIATQTRNDIHFLSDVNDETMWQVRLLLTQKHKGIGTSKFQQ